MWLCSVQYTALQWRLEIYSPALYPMSRWPNPLPSHLKVDLFPFCATCCSKINNPVYTLPMQPDKTLAWQKNAHTNFPNRAKRNCQLFRFSPTANFLLTDPQNAIFFFCFSAAGHISLQPYSCYTGVKPPPPQSLSTATTRAKSIIATASKRRCRILRKRAKTRIAAPDQLKDNKII